MSNLFLILVIAFVLIVIAISGLAIAWLITGRTKKMSTKDKEELDNKDSPQ